jgi:hypothetical protein
MTGTGSPSPLKGSGYADLAANKIHIDVYLH